HQAVPVMGLVAARQRGFPVDAAKVQEQVAFSLKSFRDHEQIRKGQGVGGANTTVGYALAFLDTAGHTADDTTAALLEFLLVGQRRDGAWPAVTNRPPSERSPFTSTALAILGFKKYGPAADAPDAGKLRTRIDEAVARGRDWLLNNKPETTEDKVF